MGAWGHLTGEPGEREGALGRDGGMQRAPSPSQEGERLAGKMGLGLFLPLRPCSAPSSESRLGEHFGFQSSVGINVELEDASSTHVLTQERFPYFCVLHTKGFSFTQPAAPVAG